jgi:hypothetical protein
MALAEDMAENMAATMAKEMQATYHVTFERTWSSQTHPKDFPLLAHFSPVIGATHGQGYALFAEGQTATPGIEKLCEEGKHQPLDSEIRSDMGSGRVGALIETMEPIREVPGRAETRFAIDSAHPMVSIAAMIAPSPDWCAVAADVALMEDGQFVAEKTVELYAWDVGTDSAMSYRALDADLQPRSPEMRSASTYFLRDGAPTPVGRVTFTRQ